MELEESLESYTRGVELLKSLRTRLSDAEQKSRCSLRTSTATMCSPTARPPTPTTTSRSNHLAAYFGVVFLGRGFFDYFFASANTRQAVAQG